MELHSAVNHIQLYKIILPQLYLKGRYDVISNEHLFKKGRVRLTTVSLKPIKNVKDIVVVFEADMRKLPHKKNILCPF